MSLRILLRVSRTVRPSHLCVYKPRNHRLLTRTSFKEVSRYLVQKSPIPWNVAVLLGFGVMGGVSLTAIKYFKADRTSSCQSKVVKAEIYPVMTSDLTLQQLGVVQRVQLSLRFVYLCVLFSPALITYALSRLFGNATLANISWNYILYAIQHAGPAFIKLGQWAGTRKDLFSDDFCQTLSNLHLHCTPHPWEDTERILEGNFGSDWRERLSIEDHTPIGAGCVAQVYRGQLHRVKEGEGEDMTSAPEDSNIPIAVKVLHPDIVCKMEQDIYLMKYMASWVDTLYPDVHWVAFTECVDEFTLVMEKQLDLKREAKNLSRFKSQMTDYEHIKFPTPIYPYVSSEVLVETFEPGEQISEYLRNPGGKLQKSLAKMGVEVLLDMLFVHNFVHGDLHPGNILVQDADVQEPKLVLLDCGIATSLDPLDLENLQCVFTAIVTGQGWKVADLFLNNKQTCSTLDEYRRKVGKLVDSAVKDLNLKQVRVDTLFSDLFNILIEHKVRIDPNFTSMMMAIMVIEGLGRSLDPELDILSHAQPCVLKRVKQSVRQVVASRLREITA